MKMSAKYLVFCETRAGARYHVFTDTPSVFYPDAVFSVRVDGPDQAVPSGYVHPREWDASGDPPDAVGLLVDL